MKFSLNALRHIKLWEKKGPSLGVIQPSRPHERSPYAPKFEDQSQEETEMRERCARGDEWRMARSILKLKEKDKANFFSPTQAVCIPATSLTNPEEERICGRFWITNAYAEQERPELSRVGDSASLQNSWHSNYSQLRSANKKGSNSVCQRIGFVLDSKAPRRYIRSALA